MSPSATMPTISVPASGQVSISLKLLAELDASAMVKDLVPTSEQGPVPALQDPGRMAQKYTTAHMVQVVWTAESGWQTPKMQPYGKIAFEPTASVLHYATESFEGMKVYRGYDQKLRLFRPQLNCDRMIKSNERVCLPSFDSEELLAIIADFLATECPRWLPESGSNLYVRPAMVGSGSALGIQKPPEALFFLFAALFPQPTGLPSPGMRLLASDPEFIRAWPGGFGSSKVGASYGPAMVAQAKARQNNCGQTLWLYGDEELVTEAGASNFFLIWKRKGSEDLELVTSPLDTELILDGIHRRSVLELARKRLDATSSQLPANLLPLKTLERPLTMTEIVEAHRESRLIEAFVSGTAMFVTPVSGIRYKSTDIQFPMTVTTDGQKTPVSTYSAQIKAWLEDIMYGGVEHEWAYIIDEDKPM